MITSDALWEAFETTGHVGAYLLYKEHTTQEQEACAVMVQYPAEVEQG